MWYLKQQNIVESSTFASEFVTMKIAFEQVESLHYKLRMMGVPVQTDIFCDNESVFKNITFPKSTFKKKHNVIAYNKTREAQPFGTIRFSMGKWRAQPLLYTYQAVTWPTP
jgi:hypothetical protein